MQVATEIVRGSGVHNCGTMNPSDRVATVLWTLKTRITETGRVAQLRQRHMVEGHARKGSNPFAPTNL